MHLLSRNRSCCIAQRNCLEARRRRGRSSSGHQATSQARQFRIKNFCHRSQELKIKLTCLFFVLALFTGCPQNNDLTTTTAAAATAARAAETTLMTATPASIASNSPTWTRWYNRGDNTGGDFEDIGSHVSPCNGLAPLDVRCVRVSDGMNSTQTGQNFSQPCSVRGLVCLDRDNVGGCADYKVKYLCPRYPTTPAGYPTTTTLLATPGIIYPDDYHYSYYSSRSRRNPRYWEDKRNYCDVHSAYHVPGLILLICLATSTAASSYFLFVAERALPQQAAPQQSVPVALELVTVAPDDVVLKQLANS